MVERKTFGKWGDGWRWRLELEDVSESKRFSRSYDEGLLQGFSVLCSNKQQRREVVEVQ